jgi:hypothetical protein
VSYFALNGTHRVMFTEGSKVPAGAILPGDCRALKGKVVRLSKGEGRTTIHVVTDTRYEEGETTLSFLPGVAA